jgi:DNA-binding transcriptional ArsR family regulator
MANRQPVWLHGKKILIDKSICPFTLFGMARTRVRLARPIPRSAGRSTARPSAVRAVTDAGSAYSLLHPIRRRILESLREPDSASGLARRLRMTRQVLNYHVKEMARARLLRPAGRRKRRALYEQCYVASAVSYVLSPEIIGSLAAKPGPAQNRFSAGFLLGMANQVQQEVGYALECAEAQGTRLSTLGITGRFRFLSAEQRAEFAQALHAAVLSAIERFSVPFCDAHGKAGTGRGYRLALGCYPISHAGESND